MWQPPHWLRKSHTRQFAAAADTGIFSSSVSHSFNNTSASAWRQKTLASKRYLRRIYFTASLPHLLQECAGAVTPSGVSHAFHGPRGTRAISGSHEITRPPQNTTPGENEEHVLHRIDIGAAT